MTNKTKLFHSEIEICGRVQMVGFRSTIKNFADITNLVGKVWNDKDNLRLVHVICEGEEENIKKFYNLLEEKRQQTQENKKLRSGLPKKILEIDETITSMKKKSKKDPDKLLKILELEKEKIEVRKQARMINELPLPEVNDYRTLIRKPIDKLSFNDFKTDIDPKDERLEIGVQQLIQTRIENAGNLNFDLMNKDFSIMNVKYDRISDTLEKLPNNLATSFVKVFDDVLKKHGKRITIKVE